MTYYTETPKEKQARHIANVAALDLPHTRQGVLEAARLGALGGWGFIPSPSTVAARLVAEVHIISQALADLEGNSLAPSEDWQQALVMTYGIAEAAAVRLREQELRDAVTEFTAQRTFERSQLCAQERGEPCFMEHGPGNAEDRRLAHQIQQRLNVACVDCGAPASPTAEMRLCAQCFKALQ